MATSATGTLSPMPLYNPGLQQFITYEDARAVKEKTEYVLKLGLGGIMFWQLAQDKSPGGLLDAIHEAKTAGNRKRKH